MLFREYRQTVSGYLYQVTIANICRLTLLIFLLSAPTFSGAADNESVLVDAASYDYDYDCLPASIFGLKGVRLGQKDNQVVERLGDPIKIAKSWGEDDGGQYDLFTYHYDGLTIDIVRGEVDRIHTASQQVHTPSGIHVGQRRQEVVDILGHNPRDWQGQERKISIIVCPVDATWAPENYLELVFSEDGVLVSIEYAASRP